MFAFLIVAIATMLEYKMEDTENYCLSIYQLLKGAGTPPTLPAHAKPIKVAMED